MSDPFFAHIESDDRRERLEAIQSLESIPDERVVYKLVDRLADPYWPVREASARQLLKLGEGVIDYLLDCLASENPDLRFWTGHILGRIRTEKSIRLLVRAFATSEEAETNGNLARAIVEAGEVAVEPLIEGTRDGSIAVRVWSARCLGDLRSAAGRDPLERLISDPSWAVRRSAVRALGEIGDRRSLERLMGALEDESWNVRVAATEALGRFRQALRDGAARREEEGAGEAEKALLDRLVRALADEESSVREAGIAVLGGIGLPQSIDPLVKVYREARSGELKRTVARSLANIDDPRVHAFLCQELAASAGDDLRDEILRALLRTRGTIDAELIRRSLFADRPSEVKLAIDHAVKTDGPEMLALLSGAAGNPDPAVRVYLTERLGDFDAADPKPYLYVLSEDSDPDIRRAALDSLARCAGDQAIPDIIGFLTDESETVKREALAILARYGDPDGLNALLQFVSRDEPKNLKYLAIQALAAIGGPAQQTLLQLLRHEDRDLRFWAIESLGAVAPGAFHESGAAQVARAVAEIAFADPDIELSNAALRALRGLDAQLPSTDLIALMGREKVDLAALVELIGRFGAKEDLPRLRELFTAPDRDVRFRAVNAVRRLGEVDDETADGLVALLADKYWPVRKAASDVLATLGERALPRLLPVFAAERRNADQCFWGVRTLGALARAEAAPLLIAEYERSSPALRVEIVKSLGKIGSPEAHRKLLALLSEDADDNLRFHAAKGLKGARDPGMVPALVAALADPFENVRYWVAITLGNFAGPEVEAALQAALQDPSFWVRKYAQDSLTRLRRGKSAR